MALSNKLISYFFRQGLISAFISVYCQYPHYCSSDLSSGWRDFNKADTILVYIGLCSLCDRRDRR